MEDLLVVIYDNPYGAANNMQTLRKLDDDWVVDIHDAVAVARDSYGQLHVQDSYRATPEAGAGWGVLLGTVLGGLALAPFTGGLSTAAAAGAVAAGAVGGGALGGLTGAAMAEDEKATYGISEEFVDEVSSSIKRGQSALFMLVDSNDPERAARYFLGTGGKITRTNLSPYEQERAQQILAGNY